MSFYLFLVLCFCCITVVCFLISECSFRVGIAKHCLLHGLLPVFHFVYVSIRIQWLIIWGYTAGWCQTLLCNYNCKKVLSRICDVLFHVTKMKAKFDFCHFWVAVIFVTEMKVKSYSVKSRNCHVYFSTIATYVLEFHIQKKRTDMGKCNKCNSDPKKKSYFRLASYKVLCGECRWIFTRTISVNHTQF